MKHTNPPSLADAKALEDEKEILDPIARQQRSNWVRNLNHIVVEPTTTEEPHWAIRELFWIRLYAVLEELPRHLQREFGESNASAAMVKTALACTKAIAKAFSEDELLWIDCMRHTYVHIEQVNTRLTSTNDGRLAKTRPVKLIGKTLRKSDIQARWQAYFTSHYGGEPSARPADLKIAQNFAKRILRNVSLLKRAMQLLE